MQKVQLFNLKHLKQQKYILFSYKFRQILILTSRNKPCSVLSLSMQDITLPRSPIEDRYMSEIEDTIVIYCTSMSDIIESSNNLPYIAISTLTTRECATFLFQDIFSHTDTLITLSSYASYLDSFLSFLEHLTSPLMTPDHVIPGLLLILTKLNLVIHTSRYLLSTLLYYSSLQLGLVVSNPAIRLWHIDHVVTVYIVEPLGPYYPKLDLLLYSLEQS